jgi:hypothetical protein
MRQRVPPRTAPTPRRKRRAAAPRGADGALQGSRRRGRKSARRAQAHAGPAPEPRRPPRACHAARSRAAPSRAASTSRRMRRRCRASARSCVSSTPARRASTSAASTARHRLPRSGSIWSCEHSSSRSARSALMPRPSSARSSAMARLACSSVSSCSISSPESVSARVARCVGRRVAGGASWAARRGRRAAVASGGPAAPSQRATTQPRPAHPRPLLLLLAGLTEALRLGAQGLRVAAHDRSAGAGGVGRRTARRRAARMHAFERTHARRRAVDPPARVHHASASRLASPRRAPSVGGAMAHAPRAHAALLRGPPGQRPTR